MTGKDQTATQATSRLEEITFWGDRPPGQRIPPGYSCLHPGSTFKTRRAKQLSAERGLKVFTRTKKVGRFTRAAAYYVPADILAAVEAEARLTGAERAKKRTAAAKARAKAHVRELARLADLIRALYPAIPAGEAERIAAHAYEVSSGRVGRTNRLPEEEKVVLAVRAHVRHEHTDYHDLLREGIAKTDARGWVAEQVEEVLARWTGGTEPHDEV